MRESGSRHYNYILVLGERNDESEKRAALQAGADGYTSKPLDGDTLTAHVAVGRRILEKEERLDLIIRGWRTMLDNLPFGVACLGPHGELKRSNMLFASLVQCDIKPLLGKSLSATVFSNRQEFAWLLDKIHRKQSFDRTILQMPPRNGKPRHLVFWGRPLEGEDEMVYQIIAGAE